MSGTIDRRGQKVVCIDDAWPLPTIDFCAKVGVAMPVAGKTYIVDDFFRCPDCGRSHYICLMGHKPDGGFLGFAITSFAPVDFRETDISDLVDLAAKQTAKPEVKVPLVTVDRLADALARALAKFSIAAFAIERLGLALEKKPLRLPRADNIAEARKAASERSDKTLFDELRAAGVVFAEDGTILDGRHRARVIMATWKARHGAQSVARGAR